MLVGDRMTASQIHVEPADHSTILCILMGKHGSDKGNVDDAARHNYTRYYHAIFSPIRETVTRVFELGIFGGASLRGWRDYFPKAQIVGADIDPGMVSAARGERIATYLCDETQPTQIADLWARTGAELFDVMIDDALHTLRDNLFFYDRAFHMLKPGGIYILEDVPGHEVDLAGPFCEQMRRNGWAAHLLVMPRKVKGEEIPDNNLIVMRSPG
jgi:spermidine synthase